MFRTLILLSGLTFLSTPLTARPELAMPVAPITVGDTLAMHAAADSLQRADSIAALNERLRRTSIESTFDTTDLTVIDTLDTENEAIQVVLYSNNMWKYVRNRAVAKDSTIFTKYWDTKSLFPYQKATPLLRKYSFTWRIVNFL